MSRTNQNGLIHRLSTENDENDGNRVNEETSEITRISLSEQFKKSWPSTVFGLIFFIVGMCFLFWNEGEAVKIAHSLEEALRNIEIPSDITEISPELEGRLIYLSGPLSVVEPLTEPEYGIIVSSVKLRRRVQMYQWIEIEEKKEENYYYTTEWEDQLINSDNFYIPFGHRNPKKKPINNLVQVAEVVKIGAYILGSELKNKFADFTEVTSDERPERRDIKLHSGLYYHSSDLWNPEVGDVRIQFSYAGKAGDVYTLVGLLSKDTILPFRTSNGKEVFLLRKHKVGVDEIFHLEHVYNYWKTWAIRAAGWFVLLFAATCWSNILKAIISNSAMLCGIISIDSVNVSVSMSISLLIIGFAWVWYRPFIGFCLALASIVPFVYSSVLGNPNAQPRDNYRRLRL